MHAVKAIIDRILFVIFAAGFIAPFVVFLFAGIWARIGREPFTSRADERMTESLERSAFGLNGLDSQHSASSPTHRPPPDAE